MSMKEEVDKAFEDHAKAIKSMVECLIKERDETRGRGEVWVLPQWLKDLGIIDD